MSPSQFGRVFQDVYGETPHRHLQRRRVERAMTLRQTDRPVIDVTWDVGFARLTNDDVHVTYAALRDPFGNHIRISQPDAATNEQVQDAY